MEKETVKDKICVSELSDVYFCSHSAAIRNDISIVRTTTASIVGDASI